MGFVETDAAPDAGALDAFDASAADGLLSDNLMPGVDGRVDGAVLRKLSCEPGAPIGHVYPNHLSSPSITADGLALTASQKGLAVRVVTRRATLDAPFGAWTEYTDLPASAGDSAYFEFAGVQRAIVSTVIELDPYLRELRYCSAVPATSCTPIEVVDRERNTLITQDMDGPAVVVIAGQPLMVFNVSTNNLTNSANVWQAVPEDPEDLGRWLADPLTALSRPNWSEDDPTISADGTIVVSDGSDANLWVSYRESSSAPLSAPELLEDVSTEAPEYEALLFQLSDTDLELYLTTRHETDSYQRIYRAPCTR